MGYSTDFRGAMEITPRLKPEHMAYLVAFNAARHMVRNASKLKGQDDPIREAAGLDLGPEGGHFIGTDDQLGQGPWADRVGDSVLDHNSPPAGQPGLWCGWVPRMEDPDDLVSNLEWDGAEKFYEYVDWMKYLVAKFLGPWGYKVNGRIEWRGEDWDDSGAIIAVNNRIHTEQR